MLALSLALDLIRATLILLQMSLALNPLPAQAQISYIPISSITPAFAQNASSGATSSQNAIFIPENDLKKSDKTEIIGIIKREANIYGINSELAIKIAECESRFDIFAQSSISTAKGIFQFLNGTWMTTMIRMGLPTSSDIFNPDIHIKAATWLLNEDGTKHWEASKLCWGKVS